MTIVKRFGGGAVGVMLAILMLALTASAQTGGAATQPITAQPGTAPGNAHTVGVVKAVDGNSVTLTTDAGTDLTIEVQPTTRILRVAAGQRDLKSATPIQVNEIQAGDRVLVRGTLLADGKSVSAASMIVMKQSDIAQKQQQEQEEWQKRGVGGLVTAVDPASGTITISNGPGKTLMVKTTKATIIRRYSPDSVKFDDARPATIAEIKAGDQLRARGDKNADGTELTADEIVSGTFRNIAGLVLSSDPANNTVTLKDLATKKPVTIRISADSQMRQLPEMLAQRLAMRLKHGVTPSAQNTSTGERGNGAPYAGGGPMQGGRARSGQPDLQQILSHMPAVAPGDLKKGDAVIVVATEGSASSAPTVITLLTGVEPILSASPNDNRASALLSPWSLGGGMGEDAQ